MDRIDPLHPDRVATLFPRLRAVGFDIEAALDSTEGWVAAVQATPAVIAEAAWLVGDYVKPGIGRPKAEFLASIGFETTAEELLRQLLVGFAETFPQRPLSTALLAHYGTDED